jgi:hypothetical protein
LIGQCALDKEKIVLNKVPPDYIRITSGLGDAPPSAILVLPLIFEGQVRGVARMSRPLTFVYHNPGWIRPRNVWRWWLMARPFDRQRKRIIFVTNERSEARWLRLTGLTAFYLGQNLHVRDQYFRPRVDAPKDFEAVYTGRISPQKRLYLAAQVKRICVVTYEWGKGSWDLAASEPK